MSRRAQEQLARLQREVARRQSRLAGIESNLAAVRRAAARHPNRAEYAAGLRRIEGDRADVAALLAYHRHAVTRTQALLTGQRR